MDANICRPTALLAALLLVCSLLLASPAVADTDDSSLFMEAFSAFQARDYLFSIEKLDRLHQLYPDSPLRDVALLLLARAHQRAGEYEAAAQTVNQFNKEFGNGSLAASVEPELIALGKRRQNGEKLAVNKQLRTAALKIRNEQLARERAAAQKAEQERLAREKAEADRLAREKAEAERREKERLAAVKAARDAIRFELTSAEALPTLEVGTAVAIPFRLANLGKDREEFSLTAALPAGVEGTILQPGEQQPVQKVTLSPKQHIELQLAFTMPPDRVDGSRLHVTVQAHSTKFADLGTKHELTAVAAAPLLRAVARLQGKPEAADGVESCKVTLLNVGSRLAQEVDLRVSLPPHLKLADAGGNGCWIEQPQLVACRIATLPSGQLTERLIKVVASTPQEPGSAKGTIEVLQTRLQVKESFPFAVTKRP